MPVSQKGHPGPKPVAHGPLLRGKAAEEFLAWQQEYIEKCLQKSNGHGNIQKNGQSEVKANGEKRN